MPRRITRSNAWDLWEQAGFAEEEVRDAAQDAKEKYEDAIREADYGIPEDSK